MHGAAPAMASASASVDALEEEWWVEGARETGEEAGGGTGKRRREGQRDGAAKA